MHSRHSIVHSTQTLWMVSSNSTGKCYFVFLPSLILIQIFQASRLRALGGKCFSCGLAWKEGSFNCIICKPAVPSALVALFEDEKKLSCHLYTAAKADFQNFSDAWASKVLSRDVKPWISNQIIFPKLCPHLLTWIFGASCDASFANVGCASSSTSIETWSEPEW